jgi:hypothetical protein
MKARKRRGKNSQREEKAINRAKKIPAIAGFLKI